MRAISIDGLQPVASVIGLGSMIFHPETAERDFSLLDSYVHGTGPTSIPRELIARLRNMGIRRWLSASGWRRVQPATIAYPRERNLLAKYGGDYRRRWQQVTAIRHATDRLVIAWARLFAHGEEADTTDKDLVRLFYSPENFERKRRAAEFGKERGLSLFEGARTALYAITLVS